ncbi:MAG: hypothetical protein K0R38_4678 [Polyangiaceae bacterium]|jgi:hypothetical protein|nr:hypothetical protein [Polyangiaceae bacterium]
MAAVDPEQHEVVFHVAVIGSTGERLTELLKLKGGSLELAQLQGYKSRFVFQMFPDDPWAEGGAGQELEQLVPTLDALVLTDDFSTGCRYSSSAVERLAKVLSPIKLRVPSAVFGGPALAQEWQSLSGAPVLAQTDPRGDDAVPIVKALAKALLRSNFRSTPPPPPAH